MLLGDHIDFGKLFNSLLKEIGPPTEIGDEYNLIYSLYSVGAFVDINHDECDITTEEILFCFSGSDDNANESDNQSSGIIIYIIYDREEEYFTSCEIEQV